MKIKPLLDALDQTGATTTLVHTGQHYDSAMSDVFFQELNLRQPDFNLGVGSGTHAVHTARVMIAFEDLVKELRPDQVVVPGDVNSSLACALVAAKEGIRIAHVEAGLRSRDWSMPEEVNRVVIDRLSNTLFAPSEDAVDNLVQEGYQAEQIHLVGNVMIDTLMANRTRAAQKKPWERYGLKPGEYGVVTLHRPSNVDDPVILDQLIRCLASISEQIPLLFPVHPRTLAQLRQIQVESPRLTMTEPQGYLDFLGLVQAARVVLTDSGGLQEETTALGIPCITLRENTERPITVTAGTNRVVGREPANIIGALEGALKDEFTIRCPPLWDGQAALRMANVLTALN